MTDTEEIERLIAETEENLESARRDLAVLRERYELEGLLCP